MQETYRPLYHEIFTKVNNAKDKPKKLAVLRQYQSPSLEMLLKAAFDPQDHMVDSRRRLYPYMPNDAPEGTEHTILEQRSKEVTQLCST